MKLLNSKPILLTFLFLIVSAAISGQAPFKRNNLFDFNWRFHRGGAQGAEAIAFDDSQWRKVDLPHDWSIEDLPGTNSPFSADAISQVSGGFTTGGTGWYRKTFIIPAGYKDTQISIMFEGIYMNAEVWLNGEMLGSHPYGYTSFFFDITGKVKFEKENVLAVKVKNEGENSRWYSGSGIYRHVWLNITAPVHFASWGTHITTPFINDQQAQILVETSVTNNSRERSKITLLTKIISSDGQEQANIETEQYIEASRTNEIKQEMKLAKPLLWSTETPVLYKAVSEIHESGLITDKEETEFGIRAISFDALNGFLLNGKPIKLKGGCVHHDNGILGSKAYDRAEERRVELLKSSGFNAIRCAHNPPSPAFLKACDHLGMLVIDEAFDMWKDEKNPYDYHLYFDDWWKKDIESMVLRDRNHPSVIMWSIGNEIPERTKPEVIAVAKNLRDLIKQLDPIRPITSAVNDLNPEKDPYFAVLDIGGYNYASIAGPNQKDQYETDHDRVPQRIMVGTESFPLEAFGSWMAVRDHPYVIGDFVWTAFDYIGEASIGWRGYWQKHDFFPWNLAFCGDLDICGWKRAQSYYRDVLWKDHQISIWVTPPQPSFPLNPERQSWSKWHWYDAVANWNWKGNEGKTMDVNIYSSCGQAELFLNNKSLGKKTTDRTSGYTATWQVPYEAGTLRAIGYEGKKQVTTAELYTASEATQIKLSADVSKIKSDGQDLCYITVELLDKEGNRNPGAENLISFEVEGPATIAGTGNANPVSLESFQSPGHHAWQGRCMVILKSDTIPGKITLKAASAGLKGGMLTIESVLK
jgi:beta-galactosidase